MGDEEMPAMPLLKDEYDAPVDIKNALEALRAGVEAVRKIADGLGWSRSEEVRDG